jgi:hypothetical protein
MTPPYTWEGTLQVFLDWLKRIQLVPPPTKGIKILELGHVDFINPEDYANRFVEIMQAGHSWINMECFGVHDECLIIAIRLPNPEFENVLKPGTPTAVNFGGPQQWVLQNNWQLPVDYFTSAE